MISFVVFNKNYARYYENLLKGFERNNILDNCNFNIFLFDDGSTDNSSENFSSLENTHSNVKYIQLTKNGNVREFFSTGQLDAVKYLMENLEIEVGEYIHFLDSDDSLKDNYNVNELKLLDVNFCNLNYHDENFNFEKIKNIERKVNEKTYMWPTVTATSGIIVSKTWLLNNFEYIQDEALNLREVWLDTRINILAKNTPKNVLYIDCCVNRLVHSNGDSTKKNYLRHIKTQAQSISFVYKYLFGSYKHTFRGVALLAISKFI